MKHIFHICPNVEESLGLEKILNFYNLIVTENTDAVEDFVNDGQNVLVAKDLTSPDVKKFVDEFSYNEKPFILSSVLSASVKISQLYDWEIKGVKPSDVFNPAGETTSVVFSIYKSGDKKIFGNVHVFTVKEYNQYTIEVLDWSKDFLSEVNRIMNSPLELADGYNTVECSVEDNGSLTVRNVFEDFYPSGIDMFTRAQIVNNETPFSIHQIFENVETEDSLNFAENYKPVNPVSQSKTYEITKVNIKSKFESVIKNDFAGGIWKYGGDSTGKIEKSCIAIYQIDEEGDKTLCLLHRGYSLYDVLDQEGIAISTKEKDTSLSSGEIFATIRIPASIIDSSGKIFGWVYQIIDALTQIQLK